MFYRLASNAFFLAGFALLGLAAYGYFSSPAEDLLEVAHPDLEIADLASGEKRTVVFHLENRSSEPLRVLGMATC